MVGIFCSILTVLAPINILEDGVSIELRFPKPQAATHCTMMVKDQTASVPVFPKLLNRICDNSRPIRPSVEKLK